VNTRFCIQREAAVCPPNKPLQLTASREIVGIFQLSYAARSRQLNGNPLGGDHQACSIPQAICATVAPTAPLTQGYISG
jgi:hypothetical protein